MRQPLVAGNWKMNGSIAANKTLLDGVIAGLDQVTAEVVVCPPAIYIAQVVAQLQAAAVAVGAQDMSEHPQGAYTGEIAADMLVDLGCKYAILGHSERRAMFGDTDARVAAKFSRAVELGVTPILCVGETLDEREQGATEAVVLGQLDAVMSHVGTENFSGAVIAYEPVWAIGTGKTASPEQAQQVHASIRAALTEQSQALGDATRILYGGSMKPDNADALLGMNDIDGGLIGGAALKANDFLAICQAAKN